MEGKHNKGIVVYTLFPELVRIRKKALIVLTWAGRNLTNRSSINHPELGAIELKTGTSFQVPLVEINDGVKVYWKESEKFPQPYWILITNIAQISAGDYSLRLWLKTPPGEKVLYDGFRFFIIEMD